MFQTYTAILGLLSLKTLSWTAVASGHSTFVLLATWSVYVYRDVWPLATYYLAPADQQSVLFWLNFAVLTIAAVVVPLTTPRKYVPYNPQDPMPSPNPEQTCSILSMTLFTFLDPIIWDGYRSPHLSVEQLPPLCDYELMKYMSKRNFPYLDPLDPQSSRHIFWGLMRLYTCFSFLQRVNMMMQASAGILTPIAVNRILHYLETGGENARTRPWFWILAYFASLVSPGVISGRYMFVVLRVLVQMQNTLTQLLFEHALRIRPKADIVTSSDLKGGNKSSPTTPTDAAFLSRDEAMLGEEQGSSSESSTAAPFRSSNEKAAAMGRENSHMIGKINNMISTDINNLEGGQGFIMVAWSTPLHITLNLVFLYTVLGWSALVGVGTTIVMLCIPGIISKYSHKLQVKRMAKSDVRVGVISEVIGSAIRTVKLFGWERRISDRIDKKRKEELHALKNFRILSLVNNISNNFIPLVTMIATFATYTLVVKGELTASKVFSSMAVFQTLQDHFRGCTWFIPVCIQAKVGLDRITDFLRETELLDYYARSTQEQAVTPGLPDSSVVGIREASFVWDAKQVASAMPGSSRRSFKLCIENELVFKRGHINLIVGPTGCGKTSLLMALLGEMHYLPIGPDSYVNLPRAGGVAYHAQESWVLNETIRNNILFGSPLEQDRYDKVLRQCALERDLSLFDAGDQTEVGERGVTLSGGQKARITLARAIYSRAETLLLDDVFAALDVHTSQSIIEGCFQGDLVRGRTVILVTHNVAIAAPITDFAVSLGTDGRIKSQGTLSSVLEKDAKLSAHITKETSWMKRTDENTDNFKLDTGEQKPAGRLTTAEEIAEGHVGWSAMKLLLLNTAKGPMLVVFWLVFLSAMLASRSAAILDSWVLGLWARQYEIHDPSQVSVTYYLSLYIGVITFSAIFLACGYTIYMYGTLRASRIIHRTLVDTILHATLRWLDNTPSSRIISRCTQDIASVDSQVADGFYFVADVACDVMLKFCVICLVSPAVAGPGALLVLIGTALSRVYMKSQLSVKREMSNAKAPVMGHVGAAITGLVSIRAYGAQEAFRQESYRRLDRLTVAARVYRNLNRWISIRGEMLAGLFSASLATYMVYGPSRDASDTGFSLTMAVGFSSMILFFISVLNDFQVEGTLERIQQYLTIEQEPTPTDSGLPPAFWPVSGTLRVENLSARYSEDGPKVLHDISFDIKSGERVGIVGRTGSGKSSLAMALLRCIPTDGKVYFDGIPTDSVNLDALRTSITIISQVPELLAGSLRENLDPFSQHGDATLNEALRSAGLLSLQGDPNESNLTLDSVLSGGGSNLSVGQRQIIALARATVRQSKLLILDEATSAVDYDTDVVIQESLRKGVAKDVTLLTIAHRLQTIMDSDKIMVLDAGHVVEFGPPTELLQDPGGFFKSLVDASRDREKLYAMVANDA
ncbi:uncharacterized protein PHACADRAFT_90147 [Phanerochaete carnosa HHB-10118-sp]|uniref:P-loop containing nucleoside triphosphate hydrolase protein n=1 Tax=Phanerochaete carnosa (strain HHB-10118-sp) TaxID=650164 RepID=K5V788_PHACS|nr:uncharacterized protein PHACADRAFT_90147 [Phanerochaete carnosa HHB-10118-sp]EKM58631.1 hypothetical protein PHACADRAFT_90147 [Phanerochaete carnosa HHB-10118-sp]